MAWHDEYPHFVYANVLLFDGKIYSWKVGSTQWQAPEQVTMHVRNFDKMDRMEVKTIAFAVNNTEEHNDAFDTKARKWYSQWEDHEEILGCSPNYSE